MLTELFWGLIIALIGAIILKTMGYIFPLIEVIAILLIATFVVLELNRRNDRKEFMNELKHDLTTKMESVEKICNDVVSSLDTKFVRIENLHNNVISSLSLLESKIDKKAEESEKIEREAIKEIKLDDSENKEEYVEIRPEQIEEPIEFSLEYKED